MYLRLGNDGKPANWLVSFVTNSGVAWRLTTSLIALMRCVEDNPRKPEFKLTYFNYSLGNVKDVCDYKRVKELEDFGFIKIVPFKSKDTVKFTYGDFFYSPGDRDCGVDLRIIAGLSLLTTKPNADVLETLYGIFYYLFINNRTNVLAEPLVCEMSFPATDLMWLRSNGILTRCDRGEALPFRLSKKLDLRLLRSHWPGQVANYDVEK